ncbi:pantetheine-phosphate adenylyltransferase [Breznakia sp. PF5-3]|uniref:pantetheine-phosphate adenylyltransferase n=1 Tax=unclassified Breznakia TaxID=2623764 RepID=UPI0024069630|nr:MULTISPECIES: pantetheine-phosphate adenylyltransferase [unclassified Breznakia]MDL2276851.1 pantetheine-phosphate adenylyltransferase [Breznakia sp. OttesenSCG-928-G09]MDF9823700.1 pantetheine-phosphate adenylyltransferase [Breznakia sp. PM6-1]MDF9834498.1 pantetheine-phosphate adenylyltransferase [Breznakia sp. PF5-3]MDF9837531.1 pantetheine-phosphate adenylyltransferase [Breznakia sp. PFB2-8]MDF9859108.1 pantetheine-phosphate adenylyltransferase [Breznakia sp. PH5-24]
MKKAIYPGSFDPITKGHMDIIKRSANIFDEVIVVLMRNPNKTYLFNEKERLDMICECCKDLKNVHCDIGSGLSIHYARDHHAEVMIRGIRAVQDYEYELRNATANMWIDDKIETCFFMAKPEYSFLSSSSVKEIASFGEDVSRFVDPYVITKLKEKYK